jgi:hypothetical protein
LEPRAEAEPVSHHCWTGSVTSPYFARKLLTSDYFAIATAEHVGWAVHDADDAEREEVVGPPSANERLSSPREGARDELTLGG